MSCFYRAPYAYIYCSGSGVARTVFRGAVTVYVVRHRKVTHVATKRVVEDAERRENGIGGFPQSRLGGLGAREAESDLAHRPL